MYMYTIQEFDLHSDEHFELHAGSWVNFSTTFPDSLF